MRNLKKFLALVMAMLTVLGAAVITTGAAATDADYTDAAQNLAALKVLKGDNGNLMLDNNVTRYQAALLFAQALTGKTEVAVWNETKKSAKFTDVPEYGTAIDYAADKNIVKGRGNGIFGYNDNITYQDMLVMAVRALGYETENMSYPLGYIEAASKLGLTDNVDLFSFTAALKRGETAQIIWDMLNTPVAFVDPLTKEIVYPDDTSLTGELLEKEITRKTLLENSGFASAKFLSLVTDFIPANEDVEGSVDQVELDETVLVDAADLGITADTPKAEYLGLPVEILIDCEVTDFETKYAEDEANIVFATFPKFKTVTNIGSETNIRTTETAVYLGSDKFTEKNCDSVKVAMLTEEGWKYSNSYASDFASTFTFDTKKGEYKNNANTFGSVKYATIVDGEDTGLVVLYTPYEFGQYGVKTLKDSTTAKNADFTTVAKYNNGTEKFDAYIVGSTTKVTEATTSVAKRNSYAKDVKLEGASVKDGDFMFYAYNALDNVLTVGANCGGFETGRLTSYSKTKKTVKIDGANVGTATVTGTGLPEIATADLDTYINALEKGKDNVKYITVDGKIVYLAVADAEAATESKMNYVIVSTDADIIADLLGISAEKYEAALVGGYYFRDGYATIAVLDTTTGAWSLASLNTIEAGVYDKASDSFKADIDVDNSPSTTDENVAVLVDVATCANRYDLFQDYSFKNGKIFEYAQNAFANGGIMIVRNEDNGVYDLAPTAITGNHENDLLTYGTATDIKGLSFVDNNSYTTAITDDDDKDPARVLVKSSTILVAIDNAGNVGVRKGVQKKAKSLFTNGDVYFLSANSNLIVAVYTGSLYTTWAGKDSSLSGATTIEKWAEVAKTTVTNYYVALPEFDYSYEIEDDKYILTIEGVLDWKARKATTATVEFDTKGAFDTAITTIAGVEAGEGFKLAGTAITTYADLNAFFAAKPDGKTQAAITHSNENNKKMIFSENGTVDLYAYSGKNDAYFARLGWAVNSVTVNVITVDLTGLDRDDYDFGALAIKSTPYDPENEYNVPCSALAENLYAYEINDEFSESISAPTAGVLDQFIIDTYASKILVPEVGADNYDTAEEINVEIYGCASNSASKDGDLTVNVLKILTTD